MRLFLKIFLAVVMAMPMVASAQKAKLETVYLFGVGINFADSTVYLSAVERLDEVPLDRSQGYLLNRYAYSEQLYQYLYTKAEMRNETCAVVFSTSRAKAEKRYLHLRRKMIKERGVRNVIEIPGGDFHFKAVPYRERTQN